MQNKHKNSKYTPTQELEPNLKEAVLEPVPEGISRTKTDIRTNISHSIKPVPKPERYKIIN